jgi:hypothetical protein
MSSAAPRPLDPVAALFSFVVPGLGQIYQGRVAKGLLFLVALHGLFFYGMYLGSGHDENGEFVFGQNVFIPDASRLPPVQVPVRGGEVPPAFKALAYRLQYVGQFWMGVSAWPAIYQYRTYQPGQPPGPPFYRFQRPLTESERNDLERDGSKRWDLGWVLTVIAGVLNVLVIYDALAGPAFRERPAPATPRPGVDGVKGATP